MKIRFFALLLFVLTMIPAARTWAGGTIREADYPKQYDVLSSNKTSKLMVEKSCSMTLRDRTKTNIALNVEKKGSCHVLDSGKMFQGRENEKKNEIELVIPEGKDKARVENWQIIGTVDMTPSATPKS